MNQCLRLQVDSVWFGTQESETCHLASEQAHDGVSELLQRRCRRSHPSSPHVDVTSSVRVSLQGAESTRPA